MQEKTELNPDLSAQQESGNFDVSDVVSPFEIPERQGPVVDLIQERLNRAYEFTRQQRGHFRTGHYPLQLKRWRTDTNYDFTAMELTVEPGSEGEPVSSIITIKKSRKKERPDKRSKRFKVASLPLDEGAEPDPDFSALPYIPVTRYFIAYEDMETISRIIQMSYVTDADTEEDPEVLGVMNDDQGKANLQWSAGIGFDLLDERFPRANMEAPESIVEEDYSEESHP